MVPLPRALWVKAPFALLAHPVGFLAVVAAALLVAMGAAAAPLMNAGAESEALQNKVQQLTPLGAGLTIERDGRPERGSIAAADARRRAAAVALGRTLPSVSGPVLTSTSYTQVAEGALGGNPLVVVAMARTDAAAHVVRLSGDGHGAWVSSAVAKVAHLTPGDRLELVRPFPSSGRAHATLRIGAVYRQLDADLSNPYWVNFIVRIRSPNPDAPLPPTFVLLSPNQLYRIAGTVGDAAVSNVYEYPVDTSGMTPQRARQIARAFADVRRSVAAHGTIAQRLGCGTCRVTSSLLAAVALASESNAALRPVISVLAGFCVLLAVAAAVVAGGFTTRRRATEARLSLVLGERGLVFATRTLLEAFVPAAIGAAAGLGAAIALVRALTPQGTVGSSVVLHATLLALGSVLVSAVAVAVGATAARGRLAERVRRIRIPWEAPVVAAAIADWIVVTSGRGLVRNAAAGSHPRLVVLVLPALVAAALAGAGARAIRFTLRRRAANTAPTPVYLALRRLAAARGLLVVLTVTVAVGIAALGFAQILQSSLDRSSVEKAYVANGSDVQAVVDVQRALPPSFPYPATTVTEGFNAGRFASGDAFDLLSVEPRTLQGVLEAHWPESVRRAVRALAESRARLPAVAIGTSSGPQTITIGNRLRQVDVVATPRLFPGMVAGSGLLVVPTRALPPDPSAAFSYVWISGPPRQIEIALARSDVSATYVTRATEFSQSADFTTITRTYGLLRVVAFAFALIALIAFLLYLHARARAQLVASEFLLRMGLSARAQAASVALEATLLVAFATVTGLIAAVVASGVVVDRVDPLPQYAPSPATIVPWATLLGAGAAVVAMAALLGFVATLTVDRDEVGEALRVA